MYTDLMSQQVQTIDLPVTFQSGSYSTSQEKWSTIQTKAYASFKKMVFYLRDAQVLIRSDPAPLRKFMYSNTTNDRLMAWAQDLFAITPHIEFEHLKGSQNILLDAIMRIKRLSLYNEIVPIHESHNDVPPSVSPSQANLEIPIFDHDIIWQVHKVPMNNTTNGFMLNNTWYEIYKTPSEEPSPSNDLMNTKVLMVQLKLSTDNLWKLQAADKQHSKIRDQLIQGQEHHSKGINFSVLHTSSNLKLGSG